MIKMKSRRQSVRRSKTRSTQRLLPVRKQGSVNTSQETAIDASIGTKIRHTRLLNSVTLKQVAEAAGCSESAISRIENGLANPSLNMVHRIAAALGLTVGRLFALEED